MNHIPHEIDSGQARLEVAPWGSPPTPLLPRWYRDNLPNVPVSRKIRAGNPAVNKIGDLSTFWNGRLQPIDDPIRRSLLHIANTNPPPSSLVVIPAEIDRAELLGPLSVRTTNALVRSGFLHLTGHVSVDDLLAIPNFGMTSLLELMCVAEAAGVASPEGTLAAPAGEAPNRSTNAREEKRQDPQLEPVSNVPEEVHRSLEQLCRWASTEGGIKTVAELLDATRESDGLPPDLARLWHGAVRSRIATSNASDPLAAILDWYRSLDKRRQVILSSRTLVFSGARTLQDIASEFGVSRERIRQVEGRLIEDLERLPRTKAWEPVLWRVHKVRRVAGVAIPLGDEPTEALLSAGQLRSHVEADIVRAVILRLAGPYKLAHGWLVTDAEKLEAALVRLMQEAKRVGSIGFDTAREVMCEAGLRPRIFAAWLTHKSGMRDLRRSVIEWPRTIGGRVLSLMRLRQAPLSPDELLADLGPEVGIRSLRAVLSSREEFVRIERSKWGLRAWGLPEYAGIASIISEELSQNGPSLRIDELAARLSVAWGVAESSVIALCNAPRFVVEHGLVRHRRDDDPFPVSTDLSRACGVFKRSDNEVSVLIDIDHDLLRGSGRSVAEEVAGLLAVMPGDSRAYEADAAAVRLSWPDTSISGPTIGSLRIHAEALGGKVGDRLRVTFHREARSVDVRLVAKKQVDALAGDLLLREMTGLKGLGQELLSRLAAAVESDTAGLARFLRRRGDAELADHVPSPDTSPALEAQIDRLARVFEA